MGETEVENLQNQALAPFAKSFNKRYEEWKKRNLLGIALETMPKQVNQDKVVDRLIKLYHERKQNLSEET